ncbi:uncharacterized protein Gasu_52150 [Galdieria sulphuraria]|uniref:Phosphatidate cytidylyltransferase n=1 Tax=Galdieria sulphuraria TaxID=130081 RepID=M2WTK3_GALSU|nr:uncharacterized protein Gasu_52150 [Galdieria sulphuraria]EME27235.1 hypothetical protein Gasu_52150 [Galdieria sulphuraria]|eukprot:XP_005703755.1 hypothetical protein Gasu_52150 [Galdieria sulphuraria]
MIVGFLIGSQCSCFHVAFGKQKNLSQPKPSLFVASVSVNCGTTNLGSRRGKVCKTKCSPIAKRFSSGPYEMPLYNLVLVNLKWSFIVNSAIFWALLFSNQRILTRSGLLHAYILGLVLWCCLGYSGWSTCVLFLILGSLCTRIGRHIKEERGIAEKRGGARGPENVWGAAGSGAFCALLYGILSPYGISNVSLLSLAFVASLSSKLADTVSSEIGKAYGKRTFLVTNWKPVAAGTDGAVSLEGTLAGILGALLLSCWAWIVGCISFHGMLITSVASLIANYVESFIGAKFQAKWKISNECVNAIMTTTSALLAIGLGLGLGVHQ